MPDNLTTIHLTDAEMMAVFRSLVDYRRALELSALRDSEIVGDEILAVDAVTEKIGLAFYFPVGDRHAAVA